MRPDIIRLLVDKRRKNLVVEEEAGTGKVEALKTIDRVGLSRPLDEEARSPTEGLVLVDRSVE